jgi:hypothetical protein
VLVDVEVRAVGQHHDLAHRRREIETVVGARDALAGGDELGEKRLVVQAIGEPSRRATCDESRTTAGDVDELADEIRIDLGRELVEVEVEVIDAGTEPCGEVIAANTPRAGDRATRARRSTYRATSTSSGR